MDRSPLPNNKVFFLGSYKGSVDDIVEDGIMIGYIGQVT